MSMPNANAPTRPYRDRIVYRLAAWTLTGALAGTIAQAPLHLLGDTGLIGATEAAIIILGALIGLTIGIARLARPRPLRGRHKNPGVNATLLAERRQHHERER